MMKLAVIFESSPFDRKGLFNAVHNRVRHLLATGECTIDVYCVHSRDNALTRRLRHNPSVPSVETVSIDDIEYKLMWYRFSILDHILLEKLHVRPWLFNRFMMAKVGVLKGYDAIIAHSFTGALFAHKAHELYGVPYYVTWHGSDVHTHPWRVPVILQDTKAVMDAAKCNFFVSKALMKASDKITAKACKEVLYNGVSEDFVELPAAEKSTVRERYGLSPEDKVVAFVGNLVSVKNVLVLPDLFARIASDFSGSLKFWIVGDGKLRASLESAFSQHGFDQIRFFGNVPSADMPSIMNSIDLLVLPSLNEGLPLVCAEALRCGANVVGSDVGGIAEVIGKDNVAPLGDGFVDVLAAKAVSYLAARYAQIPSGVASQPLSPDFSWDRTAALELSAYRTL